MVACGRVHLNTGGMGEGGSHLYAAKRDHWPEALYNVSGVLKTIREPRNDLGACRA